ncbi:phage head-tail joining protein [Pararhodobacter sp.]|uniref:phage head-tail joining protein n=1 Tax=Pararhodobacter sp. TaxID=2127056 RepID=UPI002FDEA308
MTLEQLKSRHSALLAARYSGTRSVSYDGKTVNYGSDAELAAAIGDIERRIAKLERGARRVLRPFAVKDL